MLIKSVFLYSLPYIVGVASVMVAAHHFAPLLGTIPTTLSALPSPEGAFRGQAANRSLKGDRLVVHHGPPHTKGKIYIKIPARMAPRPQLILRCTPPIDVPGRCFANAGKAFRFI